MYSHKSNRSRSTRGSRATREEATGVHASCPLQSIRIPTKNLQVYRKSPDRSHRSSISMPGAQVVLLDCSAVPLALAWQQRLFCYCLVGMVVTDQRNNRTKAVHQHERLKGSRLGSTQWAYHIHGYSATPCPDRPPVLSKHLAVEAVPGTITQAWQRRVKELPY